MDRVTFLQLVLTSAIGFRQDEPTAEMRYRQATDLIIRGKRFERAAEILRLAQKQAPEESRIPAALGCALVSRVASLAYAAMFAYTLEADQRNYPKEVEAWAKGQEDPESEYYKEPRPTPPPIQLILRTRDDEQPFRLRPNELSEKAAALAQEATSAFDTARKLAKTPEAQAEAAYIAGWGLRILEEYAMNVNPDTGEVPAFSEGAVDEEEEDTTAPKTLFPKPDAEAIRKAFIEATEKDPAQAAYWQSLGDVESDPKKAEPAYRKSLECNPRNASLWYRLYEQEMRKSTANLVSLTGAATGTEAADMPKALADLRMAARYDPSNAWYSYEEAAVTFKATRYSSYQSARNAVNSPLPSDPESAAARKQERTDFVKLRELARTSESRTSGRRAVSLVERGNQAPDWHFPIYQEPVPRLLAVARAYNAWITREFTVFARTRELARALSGYAIYLATEEQDNPGALRACRAAIGLGQRLEGDWPEDETYLGDASILRTLVGHAIVAIGMKMLIEVEKTSGSTARITQAQTEFNTFTAKVKEHRTLLQKYTSNWKPYNYY